MTRKQSDTPFVDSDPHLECFSGKNLFWSMVAAIFVGFFIGHWMDVPQAQPSTQTIEVDIIKNTEKCKAQGGRLEAWPVTNDIGFCPGVQNFEDLRCTIPEREGTI